MNRLWVRLSFVIALVVILIGVFAAVGRNFGGRNHGPKPFPPESDIPAELLALIPAESINRYRDTIHEEAWQNTILALAVGGLFATGVGVTFSRSLVRPLGELEKGAKAIAGHNLAYRVPEQGSSELRTVARAFNEMAAELEQSEQLRRNMLADVTHELRHPVQVLRGNLQGILDGVFPLNEEEISFLSEQTLQLSRLVTDLHDLALAEAHELPMHPHPHLLNKLVQDALDTVAPLAAEKELILTAEVPAEPVWGMVDAGRMGQALRNLLSNAIRYTPEGGRVTITLEATAATAHICVADNGIGLSAAELPFVFNRFYRADASRNREQGGAGLGLGITKAIVEAHNGQITAASEGMEHGSTFTIALPRAAGGEWEEAVRSEK